MLPSSACPLLHAEPCILAGSQAPLCLLRSASAIMLISPTSPRLALWLSPVFLLGSSKLGAGLRFVDGREARLQHFQAHVLPK
jgi:hypothetical protein